MCSPAAAVAGVSAAASMYQSSETTKATAAHQKRVQEANAQLTKEQGLLAQTQLRKQQAQEHESTSLQLRELRRRAEVARGQAVTAAAETGTIGESVAALNAEFHRQEVESVRNLYLNQEFRDDQHDATAERIRIGESISLLSNLRSPVTLPSFLGATLRIGTAAYEANEASKSNDQGAYKG